MSAKQKLAHVLKIMAFLIVTFLIFAGQIGAGSLDPPGPPGSTMKTLDEIPPTWNQILPSNERFVLVMGDEAVLDKETGLVWEQSPSTISMIWNDATQTCYYQKIGGRYGWRPPTAEELGSLIDDTQPPPKLPAGHPFENISTAQVGGFYWSSTTSPRNSSNALGLHTYYGGLTDAFKSDMYLRWCVRGGHGHDAY